MKEPSEDTLHHLNRIRREASQVDLSHVANELREITTEYNAWLTGVWTPSESEWRGFFAERFAMARHYAHQADDRRLAIALTAAEEEVLG